MNVTCQLKLTWPRKAVHAARSSLADEKTRLANEERGALISSVSGTRMSLKHRFPEREWVDGPMDSYIVCLVRASGIGPPKRGPKLRDPALRGPDYAQQHVLCTETNTHAGLPRTGRTYLREKLIDFFDGRCIVVHDISAIPM